MHPGPERLLTQRQLAALRHNVYFPKLLTLCAAITLPILLAAERTALLAPPASPAASTSRPCSTHDVRTMAYVVMHKLNR